MRWLALRPHKSIIRHGVFLCGVCTCPRVCLGSLWLIRFPPTVQRTAVIGVKLAAHKCLSVLTLQQNGDQGVPHLSPSAAGIASNPLQC